jgi:hypothetical protein
MPRLKLHSGLSLMLAGAAGILFFAISDPHCAIGRFVSGAGVDAVQQAWTGTVVGLFGSAITLLMGLWLLTRPAV